MHGKIEKNGRKQWLINLSLLSSKNRGGDSDRLAGGSKVGD